MKKPILCLAIAVLVSVALCGCPAITGSSVPVSVGDNVTVYQGTSSYCSGLVKQILGPWIMIQYVQENVILTAWVNTNNLVCIRPALSATKAGSELPGK